MADQTKVKELLRKEKEAHMKHKPPDLLEYSKRAVELLKSIPLYPQQRKIYEDLQQAISKAEKQEI